MTHEKIFMRKNGKQVRIEVRLYDYKEPIWTFRVDVRNENGIFVDVCRNIIHRRGLRSSSDEFRQKMQRRQMRFVKRHEVIETMRELVKKIADSVENL